METLYIFTQNSLINEHARLAFLEFFATLIPLFFYVIYKKCHRTRLLIYFVNKRVGWHFFPPSHSFWSASLFGTSEYVIVLLRIILPLQGNCLLFLRFKLLTLSWMICNPNSFLSKGITETCITNEMMNLWGYRLSQNANQKSQDFLPYQTNKDRSTFFWWFFGECWQFFWLRF